MAKNTMRDLQNHLFEVIEGLKNNSDPEASENEKMDLPTAKAICQAAGAIIESAKAEVEFLKVLRNSDNPELTSRRAKNLMLGASVDSDTENQ